MPSRKLPLTQVMSVEEIQKVTEPLTGSLPYYDRISLSHLKLNYKVVISKIYKTGSPVLLDVHGYKLFLCDPNVYIDLERKRQSIFHGLKTIEEALQVGKIDFPDERIQRLMDLKSDLEEEKRALQELEWSRREANSKIAKMQKEVRTLTKALTES